MYYTFNIAPYVLFDAKPVKKMSSSRILAGYHAFWSALYS